MLVGYSRGGATVQNMAWMTWMAQPEVEIDLVVTIAPVEFAHPVFISHKQPNVKRHINLLSGQEWAAIPIGNPEKVYPPDIPLPEFRVPEADIERVYKGTSHFSIIAREMLIYTSLVPVKTKPITPNPVWTLIEAEAAALS
ncbi:MAG: hypothetical protein GFH25_541328n1 [Chloroflexi bacterium AL-N10]|nr:hypothetical protein [Chloroflexi bacterium AL-N1]NOK71604.1 hypothetical protein [Chloroflexi bacterium AL-N10]NOK78904.1 hypothetical protein [Chloroflexi bacterium AL-N5]